jgi:ABC-type transport system substrate-binding protein
MRSWLLVGILLAGCSGGFSERGNRQASEYRWLLRYDVKTLDPAAINDWTTGEVLHYLYPTVGELCDISASDDNKSYTLTVKNTYFSGDAKQEVGAVDIAHTLERCMKPEVQSGLASLFVTEIEGAEAFASGKSEHISGISISGNQVTLSLTKPDTVFADKLKSRSLGVVNHKLTKLNEPIKDWKPGYGASRFSLKSFVPGTEWVVDNGAESIKFQFVGDSASRKTQFDVDKADQAMFAAHEIPVVKGHSMLTKGGPTTLVYLQFNQKIAPFNDRANRLAIVSNLETGGLGNILDNKVDPPAGFGTLSSLGKSVTGFKATQPKPFEFDLVYADIGHSNPVVEVIITQLRKLGIKASAKPMTSGGLIAANNRGELPCLFTGWQPDFPGPLNTVPYLFHSKSPENHSGFADPQVDQYIDLAQAGTDPDTNIARALDLIHQNIPGVPLYVQRDLVLKRREPPSPL